MDNESAANSDPPAAQAPSPQLPTPDPRLRSEHVGTVMAVLPSALYRVALANGHSVLAGLDQEARRRLVRLTPGDGVRVRLSPYDFSRGRILGRYPEPGGAAAS